MSTEMCEQSEVDAVQKMSNVIALKEKRFKCHIMPLDKFYQNKTFFFYYIEITLQFAKNIQYDLHNVAKFGFKKKTNSILFCH